MTRKPEPPPSSAEVPLSARPTVEHAALALRELPALMAPLARWLLRNGAAYGAVADALKQVFVDAARAELQRDGRAPTVSALSVLSGVHRKDVKALEQRPRTAEAVVAGKGVPLASQVFTRWMADKRLRGRDGRPRALARSGPAPSFEALAREVSQDVHPRTVLEELLRLGLVELADEQVRPTGSAFIPSRRLDELTALFAANARDHLAAAVHNLTVDAPRYLEQSVFADGLGADSVERLHTLAREAWAQAFRAMVDEAQAAVQADAAVEPPDQQRIRFGVYFYAEPVQEAPGTATASAPTKRAPRRRKE
ncbi:DUF6502 family protein [Piscinibacter defluvii]|uniref:DUF6502 family protein n=1 Tax=Piscinibacter defluvii TaxID=1796922 RepID=UPI000FDD0459|nr:DUF6502 family protein [Piscinibacter defluvii]